VLESPAPQNEVLGVVLVHYTKQQILLLLQMLIDVYHNTQTISQLYHYSAGVLPCRVSV